MTIRLDHTIVPAKDKIASATFLAEIFGLTVEPDPGHFAGVQVRYGLTPRGAAGRRRCRRSRR
jgi:hypothetical protein